MTRDRIDRIPVARRRFLQGSAVAAAAAALPLPKAQAGPAGCDPFTTPKSFMGTTPSPSSVLGISVGVDRDVTSAEAITYVKAAAQASSRVVQGRYGTSVQGRPLHYAIVGKPANVTPAGLEAVRQANLKIRDPRTPTTQVAQLAASTPAICWVIGNIHGSEESGTDTELRILYELADRNDCVVQTLLERMIVLIIPCQNPDGREADTRRNAYGFDLNRDVFARTQPETDSRMELMRRYPPVLLVDDHEFGYYRGFFPPNNDPIYHEVSRQSLHWINDVYGAAITKEYRRQDMAFFHGGVYDFFSPQYNDTGATMGFGAAGMTVECYNGLSLPRRLHHHYVASMASLWAMAGQKAKIMRGLHQEFVEAVDEGRAGYLEKNDRYFDTTGRIRRPVPRIPVRHYFLRPTPGKLDDVRRMVRRLQRMDVQVYRLKSPLKVPDFHPYTRAPRTVTLPAGTFWIPMAQPRKHWIQALMNENTYMPTNYTYGLTGWSNPLLMNLDGGYSGAKLRPNAEHVPPMPEPPAPRLPSPLPRIGVYQMSFGSFAIESVGATRWLFDTQWHVPYTMLTNHDIANGGLHGIDVVVAPGGDFPTALQYLGVAGKKALRDFVNHGGRYVGYRGGGSRLMAALGITTAGFQGFYPSITIDGTLVRMALEQSSPLAKGVGPFAWGIFDAYDAYMYAPGSISPIRFPTAASGDFAISGFALGQEELHGKTAVVDEFVGRGRVVLMGHDPNFRGHVEGLRKVLWNAIFGPDPKRHGTALAAGDPRRRVAESRARASVMSEPGGPGALFLTVAEGHEAATAALLRHFGATFQVHRLAQRVSFSIRNPGEWTMEEHPWAIELGVALRSQGVEVLSFDAP